MRLLCLRPQPLLRVSPWMVAFFHSVRAVSVIAVRCFVVSFSRFTAADCGRVVSVHFLLVEILLSRPSSRSSFIDERETYQREVQTPMGSCAASGRAGLYAGLFGARRSTAFQLVRRKIQLGVLGLCVRPRARSFPAISVVYSLRDVMPLLLPAPPLPLLVEPPHKFLSLPFPSFSGLDFGIAASQVSVFFSL